MAATQLDHVVPVHKSPDKFWDTENWQALCKNCHEKKTADENRCFPLDEWDEAAETDGWDAA